MESGSNCNQNVRTQLLNRNPSVYCSARTNLRKLATLQILRFRRIKYLKSAKGAARCSANLRAHTRPARTRSETEDQDRYYLNTIYDNFDRHAPREDLHVDLGPGYLIRIACGHIELRKQSQYPYKLSRMISRKCSDPFN